ncbi:diguanylate phosphsdiesterase [Actinoplanes sp. SE50]|uniref:sensor domain-containing phosphodiesterase n=1 Tax=unclassified Actinoplanes TaxID=2626549 RepID=UPI00023EC850|nr:MULTISPECIES: EAL domain-containing protein [unclassified Actinoplanes]AEV86488.1 Signaling protein ykoW [Actinoplanes sp. SE50/110]ATO84886.1 diguanylate phosphsdiesterase [Actinoplanes sp. SE50]SLM02295.1 diguanylate phosphodiesterase [Actinoplanes sp. SE50/110]
MPERSETAHQVADLLRTAREALGMSVAFLSRMEGPVQHLEVVESDLPLHDGMTQVRATSLCQAIEDGTLPPVIPDLAAIPAAAGTPALKVGIRSYISVPVELSDGTVYGTFCGAGLTPDPLLDDRDRVLMRVLAHAAAMIIEPDVRKRQRNAAIERRLRPVLARGGPVVLLQPIVDLATGRRSGAEALSRFPREWQQPPDEVFADAALIGERENLELAALRRAADHLPDVAGYVAMNISPATLFTDDGVAFLSRLPLDRIVLELSEHDPVDDYARLRAVLAPLRARGMRLAIDDVGAGFSSLRHIVATAPDVIKLDRSIVSGVAGDHVLSVVVRALADLAGAVGATVVAEGIETAADAAALAGLGADLGQGWLFDKAVPAEDLRDAYDLAPAACPS